MENEFGIWLPPALPTGFAANEAEEGVAAEAALVRVRRRDLSDLSSVDRSARDCSCDEEFFSSICLR